MSTKRNKKTSKNGISMPRKPLSPAEFERELTKVVNGDANTDEHIKAFWDDARRAMGIRASIATPQGIEVMRKRNANVQ